MSLYLQCPRVFHPNNRSLEDQSFRRPINLDTLHIDLDVELHAADALLEEIDRDFPPNFHSMAQLRFPMMIQPSIFFNTQLASQQHQQQRTVLPTPLYSIPPVPPSHYIPSVSYQQPIAPAVELTPRAAKLVQRLPAEHQREFITYLAAHQPPVTATQQAARPPQTQHPVAILPRPPVIGHPMEQATMSRPSRVNGSPTVRRRLILPAESVPHQHIPGETFNGTATPATTAGNHDSQPPTKRARVEPPTTPTTTTPASQTSTPQRSKRTIGDSQPPTKRARVGPPTTSTTTTPASQTSTPQQSKRTIGDVVKKWCAKNPTGTPPTKLVQYLAKASRISVQEMSKIFKKCQVYGKFD